jgi:nitroreductase
MSVRSFDGKPLAPAESIALEIAFEECVPGPFGNSGRFVLVSAGASGLVSGDDGGHGRSGKIGTYGLVTRVPAFIVGAIRRAPDALEDFGYAMEGLVLRATDLGLATCWIGGAFGRSATARALSLKDDEIMPAIVAVGRPAEKMTIAEIIIRSGARAGTRKVAELLFHDGSFGTPLQVDEPWIEVLEALRLAPSASNKQPWRIVRGGPDSPTLFHLYLEEDRLYNSLLGEVRLQNVDLGIAMRHFEAAAGALSIPGRWIRLDPEPPIASTSRKYIVSWVSS